MKIWIVIPYWAASFVSAFFLFAAEPMIGKMALPPLGGTPAVWNSCLLFFQVVLLAGYLLALGASHFGRSMPRATLLVIVGLLALGGWNQPISINLGIAGVNRLQSSPAISLWIGFITGAALPLALISVTSPLTQHWFARTDHPRAHEPYFLYAASNTGSLFALLAYPLWIEPRLSLTAQGEIWKRGYAGLAMILLVCGLLSVRGKSRATAVIADRKDSDTPTARERLRWVALAAIPSSWLLGVTSFLTTNLAAMPLLWVIPLAIFLIASILAFADSTRRTAWRVSRFFPWAAFALVLVQLAGFVHAFWIPLHLFTFFLGCLVCNVRLAESRPATRYTTSFYLAIAVGGVLGGGFNVLVAPIAFDRIAEYPLAILAGCFAFPTAKSLAANREASGSDIGKTTLVPALLLACTLPLSFGLFDVNEGLMGAFLLILASGLGIYATLKASERPLRFILTMGAIMLAGLGASDPAGATLLLSRSFYGVLRVTVDREANCHRLLHGGTLHGEQSLDPLLRAQPRTYFARSGPVGDIFRNHRGEAGRGDVAIIGLGVGTLAAYAEPGERWTFFELDPSVVRVARNPRFFTYLADSRADAQEFIVGDARLRIRDATDSRYSLIVLDAFGADAVPVHLISREAIRLYLSKLAPGGRLVFNITNGYVDLEPVIGRQAIDAGLVCRVRRDVRVSPEERRLGKQGSIWAVMARSETDLEAIARDSRWRIPRIREGARPWTDDDSDLASYLLIFGRRVPEPDPAIRE